MINNCMWIILLALLLIFSFWDMREKQLPVRLLVGGILFSVAVTMLIGRNVVQTVIISMLPGVLLVLFALATRGKIGSGDGLVLMLIGNMVGVKWCLMILVLAVMLSFCFSCLLLTVFKKSRTYCFPFVPFYFCGAVIAFIMTIN